MSARALGRILAGYLVGVALAILALWVHVRLSPVDPILVRSRWAKGKLVSRGDGPVTETIIAEGPLASNTLLFSLSIVPGLDGVRAELDGKTAFATVEDLLAAQAYEHSITVFDASMGIGTDRGFVLDHLAGQLKTTAEDVETRARLTRVRFERRLEHIDGRTLSREQAMTGVREAAHFLARNVDEDGRFHYLILATTGQVLAGYNWPRHAGATYFLAQAAALLDDATVRYAALRAAALLRDSQLVDCGANKCISDDRIADVGSSALAVIAFAELVTTGADTTFRRPALQLAAFLRSQQRADGELMHEYDRATRQPRDVQRLYFTGEAALALSRAHFVGEDPANLDAAKRALARLSGAGWSFFGSRYYYGEEHWTCQAMADLWRRAPDPDALAFCLRWHAYQRRLQHARGDSPFDDDGSFSFGFLFSPRVTPASSRGEAAAAALSVLEDEPSLGSPNRAAEMQALDDELRRAIAFVLREQLRSPLPAMADFDVVRGGFPASPVDWQLRIDYAQHAGSMMIRWLKLPSK